MQPGCPSGGQFAAKPSAEATSSLDPGGADVSGAVAAADERLAAATDRLNAAQSEMVAASLQSLKAHVRAVAPTARYVEVEESDQDGAGLVTSGSMILDARWERVEMPPEVEVRLDNDIWESLDHLTADTEDEWSAAVASDDQLCTPGNLSIDLDEISD